jgi:uncharacterized ferredoxin-like protein
MTIINGSEVELRALRNVSELMALAARTAPKTGGVDTTVTAVVQGEEKDHLADEMVKHSAQKAHPLKFFERDADCLRRSPILLIIGVKGKTQKNPRYPYNCGACGFKSCSDYLKADKRKGEDFEGPLCVWHSVDLGIALCSAVKVAAELNVDNRIMYSIGAAAKALNVIDADVIVGIPLSASGKNIFFDRG